MASKTATQTPWNELDLRQVPDRLSEIVDVRDELQLASGKPRASAKSPQPSLTWCSAPLKPALIYDGIPSSPLGKLLRNTLIRAKFFSEILTPGEYEALPAKTRHSRIQNALVIGSYSERHAPAIHAREPGTTLYINPFDMCAPGQVKDGFFPDAVFADPNFIIPILALVLDERLNGQNHTVSELMDSLAAMPGVAMQVKQGAEVLRLMMQKKGIIRFHALGRL